MTDDDNGDTFDAQTLDAQTLDAQTAELLAATFGHIAMNRPAPTAETFTAAELAADAQTASDLVVAFAGVRLARPTPGAEPMLAEVVELPIAHKKRRAWAVLAAASAAVVALAAGLVLMPNNSAPAWAASPGKATGAQRAAATALCARNLGTQTGAGTTVVGVSSGSAVSISTSSTAGTQVFGGPVPTPDANGVITLSSGVVQSSGMATPTALPPGMEPPGGLSAFPTSLPPLAALDVRGDAALAMFQNKEWTVACLLSTKQEPWSVVSMSFSPGAPTKISAPAVVDFGSVATWAGSAGVSMVGGSVGPKTTRVTVTLPDGTVAHATVSDGRFVSWFPGQVSGTAAPSVRAYDSTGTLLTP
jgi:hypothetical protein